MTTHEPLIVRDAQHHPRFSHSVDDESGFTTRSILCAPMTVNEVQLGVMEMVNKKAGDGLFSDADLMMLNTLASSAALAILNARMSMELLSQARVKRELELAAEIQRNLLPKPGDDAYPAHGINHPVHEVSGDFYDYFTLPNGQICFAIGDVSGKGVNAALLMSKAASLFRCLGKDIHNPALLLEKINEEICETSSRGMFVTMAAGILDPATRMIRLANCGHEPPRLLTADGTVTTIPAGAPPLGIVSFISSGYAVPEVTVNLAEDTLYLFTDGVTEAKLADGNRLGSDGVEKLLKHYATLPLRQQLQSIVHDLTLDQQPLHDDITLLAVTLKPVTTVDLDT
jgi:sigma-B regulation protein RsbU (phosphoserine phosphatase)